MKNALILSVLAAVGYTAPDFCWKSTHNRGAGHMLSACPEGLKKSGLVCYPKCKEGYKGIGPACWEKCKEGQKDGGAFCSQGNNKIVKKNYARGAGKPMLCAHGLQQSGLLCYKSCNENFKGVGSVCWGSCPEGWSDCGAGCAPTKKGCGDKIISMVTESSKALANTIAMIVGEEPDNQDAKNAKKLADFIKSNAGFAEKVARYANKILTRAKANGKHMTEAEAQKQAEKALAKFAEGIEEEEEGTEGDKWDKIMNRLSDVDPTGFMAAGKLFKNPFCHNIKE